MSTTSPLTHLRTAAASKGLLDVLDALPPLSAITIKHHAFPNSTHPYNILIGHSSSGTKIYASDTTGGLKILTKQSRAIGSFQMLGEREVEMVRPFKEVWMAGEKAPGEKGGKAYWDMRRGWFKSICVWYWVQYAVAKNEELAVPKSVEGYLVGVLGALRKTSRTLEGMGTGRERGDEKEGKKRRIEELREDLERLDGRDGGDGEEGGAGSSSVNVSEVGKGRRKRKTPTSPPPAIIRDKVLLGQRGQFARENEVGRDDMLASSAQPGDGLRQNDNTAKINDHNGAGTDPPDLLQAIQRPEQLTSKRRRTSISIPTTRISTSQPSPSKEFTPDAARAATVPAPHPATSTPHLSPRTPAIHPPDPLVSQPPPKANDHLSAPTPPVLPSTEQIPTSISMLSDLRHLMTSNFIADVKMAVERYEELSRRVGDVERGLSGGTA